MTNQILLTSLLASFLTTLVLMPFWIRKVKNLGLVWPDKNKYHSPKIAGSGGVITVLGFIVGVFIYIAYRTFYLNSFPFFIEIFAMLTTVLLLLGIGLIDDLFGWQKGGLRRRHRLLLAALAALPLMAINAGKSAVALPFLGTVDLGLLYPLLIIPIGIAGATTTFNFLAGYNGLEAGQGAILLSSLALVAFLTGSPWLAIVTLAMVASLLAFLLFNFYPAKIFPGDSLTYAVGGLIAVVAILGDFERIALFFFIPYAMETILKIRGKLVNQSFGQPKKDNTLTLKYEKIYSLNHLSIYIMEKIGIKPTERKVVFSIWIFQLLIILIGFIIFREGIFQL
jgi:UDP-N-acetylglucosamine--dolichyl-phosphate N-acetylglucosaminephosphotransferase